MLLFVLLQSNLLLNVWNIASCKQQITNLWNNTMYRQFTGSNFRQGTVFRYDTINLFRHLYFISCHFFICHRNEYLSVLPIPFKYVFIQQIQTNDNQTLFQFLITLMVKYGESCPFDEIMAHAHVHVLMTCNDKQVIIIIMLTTFSLPCINGTYNALDHAFW